MSGKRPVGPPQHSVVEDPPAERAAGRLRRTTTYGPGESRGLWVWWEGAWREAWARARYDHADGHVSYQVEVTTPAGTVIRTLRWDDASDALRQMR